MPDEDTDEEVQCVECGDFISKDSAFVEMNDVGLGPDRTYYCGAKCSLAGSDTRAL